MALFSVHISQAKHNERVANHLAGSPEMYDWGITAAFYSAIHYLEAKFFSLPQIVHTETSIPRYPDGELQYTGHTWRQRLVRRHLPPAVYKAFRKLRENSETARYLSGGQIGPNWAPLDVPATQFFRQKDAQNMLRRDLRDLKSGVNLGFPEFLSQLGLERVGTPPGPDLFHKLIGCFRSRDDLLGQTKAALGERFSRDEIEIIEQALSARGLRLTPPRCRQRQGLSSGLA